MYTFAAAVVDNMKKKNYPETKQYHVPLGIIEHNSSIISRKDSVFFALNPLLNPRSMSQDMATNSDNELEKNGVRFLMGSQHVLVRCECILFYYDRKKKLSYSLRLSSSALCILINENDALSLALLSTKSLCHPFFS